MFPPRQNNSFPYIPGNAHGYIPIYRDDNVQRNLMSRQCRYKFINILTYLMPGKYIPTYSDGSVDTCTSIKKSNNQAMWIHAYIQRAILQK